MAAFDSYFGLQQFNVPGGPTFTKRNQTGGSRLPSASGTSGYSVETTLDVESAHAIAPQANIVLIEGKGGSTDSQVFSNFETAVGTAKKLSGVSVVSMSFGFPESWINSTYGAGYEAAQNSLYTTPTGHIGVTFVASSGDDGTTTFGTSAVTLPGVNFPAACPNVLAAGGTSLALNGSSYASEAAWSDGGGGQSLYESEPAYQNGVQTSGKRQVPDVSFDANPETGVPIYDSYDYGSGTAWVGIGGTSLAAPCWAGLIAIVDQLRASQTPPLGTLNGATQTLPDLYALPAADFHDVIGGYNSTNPGFGYYGYYYDPESSGDSTNGYPDSGFAATPAYNEATGLGTPLANVLASAFFNPVATSTTLGVSAGSTTYGQSVTVTATVAVLAPQTGTPTDGTVTFMDGTTTLGSPTLTNGTASVTVTSLPAGLDTLTATYSGNSNFAASSTNGQTATLVTVAGGGPLSTSGTSTSAFGAAIDSSGNLYFADPKHNEVFEVTATGTVSVVAGTGTAGYSGDGGLATAAELDAPAGLAVDSSGDIFIADTENNVIREVNASTQDISTVAGVYGDIGYSGNGLPATSTYLAWPTGVAVDSSGNLYIADAAYDLIYEVNYSSQLATIVAGYTDGTYAYYGYNGDDIPATTAYLNVPMGVAVDSSGNLYIADTGNDLVREVNTSGIISTIAGSPYLENYAGDNGPATAATLSYPTGVALDSSGDIFIADYGNDRIREINSSGVITTVAGGGLIDNGPGTAVALNGPAAIVADNSGHLYIADYANNCVRQLTLSTGVITTIAGIGISGANGDGGQGTAAALDYPTATAVDNAGHLFIADEYSQRVREVTLSTGVITTIAGNGTVGNSTTSYSGQATAAELDDPTGVAVDASGNVYIADAGNNCVLEVNASGVITTIAGDGTAGYNGDGIEGTAAELNDPTGVAVDNAGHLFIADDGNDRIRALNLSTGVITTIADNGTAGYNGDGIAGTAAELNLPFGVAVDAAGNLLIADTGNNRIRQLNLSTNIITTVAGNGTAGYSGDTGPATAASINNPLGVAADASGDIFISDTANNVVREVDSAGVIVTLAGTAAAGDRPNNVTAAAGTFDGPAGLAVDSRGNLYIADSQNDLVRRIGAAVSVSVAPKALTYSGLSAPASKVYDGTTAAVVSGTAALQTPETAGTGSTSDGAPYSGDTVSLTGTASGVYDSKDVATATTVTFGGLSLIGAQSGDYTLTASTQAAAITPTALTITADNKTMVCGAALPSLTASYSGFVNGDTSISLTTQPILTTAATSASPAGSYDIDVSGAVDPNYNISYVTGTLTVSPIATLATWESPVDGPWNSAANWTDTQGVGAPGFSGVSGDQATFNGAAGLNVDLGGFSPIIAALTFGPSALNYDIMSTMSTGSGQLQLNNGSSDATITVSAASQTIAAPVQLVSYTAIDPAASATLTISGGISGTGALAIDGEGTVIFTGTNSYQGGTSVSAGTLVVTTPSAIAANTSLTVGAGGTFIFDPSASAGSNDTTTVSNDASAATTSETSATSAVPSSASPASSSPVVVTPGHPVLWVAAVVSASGSVATPGPASVSDLAGDSPVALPLQASAPGSQPSNPNKFAPVGALGTSAADQVMSSSIAEEAAGDSAWLGQAANDSGSQDGSDPLREKDVAIVALDAAFAQYGR